MSMVILREIADQAFADEPALIDAARADLVAIYERDRSEEHTSELQSLTNLVCRLLLEKKKKKKNSNQPK